ncbi:MAG: nicotinamide-nucleotide amidohydrolase family protein [Kiritimatiellae bacterium]|nr:nicotinamide-nucleotide amidohydrolase family protein [Kiritimatiellia bacterium]
MTTAEKLVKVLTEKKMTCATAESCTGGGVGYTITAVPGSSAVFWGGIISYDNTVKHRVLDVPEEILATKGAVSPECAAAMAEGARRRLKTDLAVSITGIAGPGGGSAEKPVGLVWFGVASPSGTITEKKIFPGDREAVRTAAIEHALQLLLNAAGCSAVDEMTGVEWEYTVHGEGVTITGCSLQDGNTYDIEIPSFLGGMPVTGIGDGAFQRCKGLKSVTMPDGIRQIGARSFSDCKSLERVTLPEGLHTIGEFCFGLCDKLESVHLGSKLEGLPCGLFCWCDHLSVEVPEGVKEIYDFDTFSKVKRVILPRSLRKMGKMFFVHGKKYAYGEVHETEFVWMGSPGRIDGAQDGIDAIDAYDKGHGLVVEVPFAKYPLYKEAREIAAILSDLKLPLKKRVQAWKEMMRSDFSIPCPSSPRRVTLPDVLFDHPFGRYWCCARKMAGYRDLVCSVPAAFEADTSMYEKNSPAWKRWSPVIDAIEKDKPGKTFLGLSLKGTKFPKRLVLHALRRGAKNVLRAFYGKCPKSMQAEFPLRALLFYLASGWEIPEAVEYIRMIAEIAPDLIRDTVDARGNTALWYTLYREAEEGQKWPSTFSADNELAAVLVELGCDPTRKNALGLSWADIVEGK